MYKPIALSLLLSLTFVFHTQGQTTLSEISLSNPKINNIQSFDAGDKILLAYDEKDRESHFKRFYQVYLDGHTKQIQTNLAADALLCGVITFGKEEYLYYFGDKGKEIILKALKYDDSTSTFIPLTSEIALHGTLLATWTDENLHLVLYDKVDKQIEVIELDKFNIANRKKIIAPIDIGPYCKYMRHISYNATISIDQGSSPAKVYQNGKYVFITIDKTGNEATNRAPETVVLKFDLANETSSIQRISYGGMARFSSFLFRDKIYRVSMSSKFYDVKIFDLTEKKVVDKDQILKESIPKDSVVYFRDGKAVRVSKKETMLRMMRVSDLCFPSIAVYAENDSITTIVSGNYYNDKGMGLFTGVGLEGFVTFIVTSAIKQLAEPPGISRYTYITKPFSGGMNSSLRQKIDDYEISLEAKQEFFDYKGYLDFGGGVMAVYHNSKGDKLTLVHFKRN